MNDKQLLLAIKKITDKGNSAEVKRTTSGDYVVYEVKKNKVLHE